MNTTFSGFYAAYLTASASQGLAMFVFRNGKIVGVDVGGVTYDGIYAETEDGIAVKLSVSLPPNTVLIQGASTGPEVESSELEFQLPVDFLKRPFIRINAKHGPVNAKIVKLRGLND